MSPATGAQVIARALHELGVSVIFGLVGIPVVEVAEEAIKLGIRFIAFRNEQSCGYAASAYGYLTGRPGVCLVVGGPGVLHAMAGIGNSQANAFPLLLLAGSSETHLVTQGAFQELDAIALLTPHTRLAVRPTSLDAVPSILHNAYRASFYGRPSTAFVDLPADLIKAELQSPASPTSLVPSPPPSQTSEAQIFKVSHLIRSAKAPLIVIGKGAAYARAEHEIRALVDATKIPFLPTPMGKGVVPDSHPLNTASARSSALQHADVVLLLGARLNWILHFGDAPKWNNAPTFVQVDIEPLEIGRNASSASHGLVGDLRLITQQLTRALASPQWSYSPPPSSPYLDAVAHSTKKNIASAHTKASRPTAPGSALSFQRAFELIKTTLHDLSPPDDGRIVYISEGANTMDISRSAFPVEHPRLRLDAGTYATMGVGPGYAIAAHAAYNFSGGAGPTSADGADQARKKIVCFEGDSAFGFSAMEVETMARYGMDVLIFVMNNGGVYHGDADDAGRWGEMRANTVRGREGGLRSTSLGWEVGYEKVAEMCGGFGTVARTEEELREATRRGFEEGRVAVVNVMVESGKEGKLEFGWQASAKKGGKTGEAKL